MPKKIPRNVSEVDAAKGESAENTSARSHPVVLAVTSSFLLWFAFPPADRGYLAWLALAPVFSLVRSDRRPAGLYLAVWIGGLTFGLLSMSWVAEADSFGMLWMAIFMSLWWPIFFLPARIGVRRIGLPLMVVAPVAWVGLEYARAHVLSGFPWYYLAHSQYAYLPMIQISDLAGAWGLSLIIATVNAWLADGFLSWQRARNSAKPFQIRRHAVPFVVVLSLIASTLAYGAFRLSSASFRPGPRLALLQTDFPQALKNGPGMEVILTTIHGLVMKASGASPRPDLIIWPETSYPIGVVRIDPKLKESEFAEQARHIDPDSTTSEWRDRQRAGTDGLSTLAEQARLPMLVGSATYDFRSSGLSRYNSAVLWEPGHPSPASYHKQALVPFGEYIPFVESLPWLLKFTPYTDGYVPSLTPGSGPAIVLCNGIRYAPIICFEDTIPHVVRSFFVKKPGSPNPDVLVNLTNDGWFRGTAEHQTHLAISVFRSVEVRRPMVRAANTGISALIDGDGRIRDTLARETSGVLQVQVPLDDRTSFYSSFGDWLPLSCLLLTILLTPLGVISRRQPSVLAHSDSVG